MRFILGLLTLAAPTLAEAQVDGSFAQCAACHTVKPGENRLGPSLFGIVGRKKASAPGFNYSPAMKAQTGLWTPAELDAFVTSPRAKVPGTRMIYPGMTDPAKRARLIEWLKTQK